MKPRFPSTDVLDEYVGEYKEYSLYVDGPLYVILVGEYERGIIWGNRAQELITPHTLTEEIKAAIKVAKARAFLKGMGK